MAQPFLGLYLIVRDASKTIRTLLESLPEFDEVVIVDTGSIDDTKQIIEQWFNANQPNWPKAWRVFEQVGHGRWKTPTRLVLASFEWVDDFAAARQFSFDLGTAKWRMYLDADDDASDLKKTLRPTLERTDRESPESNCVSLKYNYVPDEMAQDKIRLVKWETGWRWEDPVHEHLVPTGATGRIISKWLDVWVKHTPHEPGRHAAKSFERNVRIAEKAYQNPATPKEKKALWAYYLGNYAHEVGQFDLARKYYREVGDGLGMNNITCEGLCRWARMEMKQGNFEKAIQLAAEAIGKAPELPDGLATMGVAQTLSGAHYRAAGVFDLLAAQPKPPMETQHDAVWLDGVCWAHAAQAYYRVGRIDDANKAVHRIPQALLTNAEVRAAGWNTQVSLQKSEGFKRLQALWEFLIWDTEPLKAKELLERFTPAAFSDSPQVKALIRETEAHMPQMRSWGDYQRTYAAIPELPYHVPKEHHGWTLEQGRARMVRQWAEALPKEGPAIEVLVIGVQDGIIETAMMEANPRINLTACDVAPQASVGIQGMTEKFPGRVKRHYIEKDHYDWFPKATAEFFDAIILFEVIEHLPDDAFAFRAIRNHLKSTGKFFLSTPIASQWVEQYLADMKSQRPWWHVRAHNPTSLWELFRNCGFTGSLMGIGEESLFLAVMQPEKAPAGPEIAIYIYPMRPVTEGFDPFSPLLEHCGGSEEAVIHLSAALARKGCKVTVYTDMPARKDQIFVHEGVQWRSHSDWDVQSLRGTLLVWRAPQLAAQFKKQNPRLRCLNWLHDTNYLRA